MKLILLLGFCMSLCKGGIVVFLGMLIKNHFQTTLALLFQKPFTDSINDPEDKEKVLRIINKIGLLIIIIGFGMMILALLTVILGGNIMARTNARF